MPASITTRAGKGSPLTTEEVDANFQAVADVASAAEISAASAQTAAATASSDAATAKADAAAAKADAATALTTASSAQTAATTASTDAAGAQSAAAAAADSASAAAADASQAQADAATALAGLAQKQDKLIAGANITIGADGKTISAAGGTGGTVVDADSANKGVVRLAGALGGTADAPTVFGMADTAAFNNAMAAKANLNGAAFTVSPTAPTPAAGDNSTKLSTTAFVAAAVAALVNSSPAALDTLNELAAALGNDANFANTMTQALAGKQPAHATLTDLASRTIGVAAASSIPSRQDVDTRFARVFTGGMPDGSVGQDGDFGILNAIGYPAVLIQKTAGVWAAISESFTYSEMQAIASPVLGMTVMVTTIDWGNGITYPVDTLFRYDGSNWKPLYACSVFKLLADSATLTNTQTAFQAAVSLIPPTGLFMPGRHLFIEAHTKAVLDGAPTYTPRLNAGGATLTSSFANVGTNYRGAPYLWSRNANKLIAGGGADGWDRTSAGNNPTEQATAFDGATVALEFGATFSAADSTTQMCFDDLILQLVP